MDAFIASIILFGGNFAPAGWAFCSGQILSIAQNTALFSLLGTTYGGNGVTTFALPDLRGRVPIHAGQGPGLADYFLGQVSGTGTVTLLTGNLPTHTHPLIATPEPGTTSNPTGAYLSNTGALDKEYNTSGTFVAMNAGAVGPAGGNLPIDKMQPYLAVSYIICLQGIFPSRN